MFFTHFPQSQEFDIGPKILLMYSTSSYDDCPSMRCKQLNYYENRHTHDNKYTFDSVLCCRLIWVDFAQHLNLRRKKAVNFYKITFPFGGISVSPPRLDRGTFLTNEPSRVEKQKLHLFETIVRLMGRNRKDETNWARCNFNFELRRKSLPSWGCIFLLLSQWRE